MGVATAALLALAGCAAADRTSGGIPVVVGFYPLQFVADRVGGDRVNVMNLAQPGAEPHDLELSPRQVAGIADARLVLHLRGFQPAVDEAVDQANAPALDVASVVPLLPGGDEPGSATDPHVWLDPTRLATIAGSVADRLAGLDPAGADGYRERAQALVTDLTTLDHEYVDGLRQCVRREIVVSHAAFGYLADRYGLRQVAITGISPDTEPTPHQIVAAATEARGAGATTIFFEALVSPDVARTVAETAGAGTAVLDPVEGLQPGSTGDYLSVMRANLATLRTALSCA
jgi:zinc transport system substrate-binding protein